MPPCTFAPVSHHHLWVIHRQPLVRIHSNTEEPRVGLQRKFTEIHSNDIKCSSLTIFLNWGDAYINHPCRVTIFEVKQHRGLVEVGHHDHVLNFIILRWIHWVTFLILHCHSLQGKCHVTVFWSSHTISLQLLCVLSECLKTLQSKPISWHLTSPASVWTVALPPSLFWMMPLMYRSLASGTKQAVLASNRGFWASIRSFLGLQR